MSVKKLLILTAAGVASVGMTAAAIAGGPGMMAPPAPADNYFYIEGNFGYAFQDFTSDAIRRGTGLPGLSGNGSEGGFAFGGDAGYMFNQYLGLEAGWTYLPRFSNIQTGVGVANGAGIELRTTNGTWFVLKVVAPLTTSVDLYAKAGLGYRYARIVFNASANQSSDQVDELRPLFAVGGTYNFAQTWMASVQFMHFMGGKTYTTNAIVGNPNLASVVVPSSNVVTLDIGYKFVM